MVWTAVFTALSWNEEAGVCRANDWELGLSVQPVSLAGTGMWRDWRRCRIDDGPGTLVQVQLTGTTGTLALGSAFDQCVQLQRGQTVTEIPLAVVDEATAPLERIVQTSVPMLRQIVGTILAGGDGGALPQMREGVRAQRLIDAALRSATEQRWVAPAALEP